LSAGGIAGVAIGSVAVVSAIAAAFYFFYWVPQQKKKKEDSPPPPVTREGTKTPPSPPQYEHELMMRGKELDDMPKKGQTPNGSLHDK